MRNVLRAGLITLAIAMTVAAQEADADVFQDKSITIFVGYGAGGGYDQYARLLSRHMNGKIAGKPPIIVRNMPGGGSLVALNHVYNVAPRDGTSIVTFGPEVAFEPLRGASGLKFDALKLNWVGSMNRQVSIAVFTAQSGVLSIADARTRKIIVGASGTGSQSYLNPIVYNAFLGTNFSVVTGYTGSKEITLAMEKGELDGIAGWSWDSLKLERPAWADSKEVTIAMQVSDVGIRKLPMSPISMITCLARTTGLRLNSFLHTRFLGAPSQWRPACLTQGWPLSSRRLTPR